MHIHSNVYRVEIQKLEHSWTEKAIQNTII